MTEAEKAAELIRYRLEQSREAVETAEVNVAHGFERSAVNRAYYAMFYAVLALLASRQLETSKHSGAISQFDLLYVKPALLPKELSRWLHDGFARRNEADYGGAFTMARQDIDRLIEQARGFLATVRRYLEDTTKTTDSRS